jgi:hypothetical protein
MDGSISSHGRDREEVGRSSKRKTAASEVEPPHAKRLKTEDGFSSFAPSRSFSTLPLILKIRILACLVEWAKLNNNSVSEALRSSNSLVRRPVGRDKWGNSYWYFDDHRLYCETPSRFNGPMHVCDISDVAEWRVVAATDAEWSKLTRQLQHSRNSDEKSLSSALSKLSLPWTQEQRSSRVTSAPSEPLRRPSSRSSPSLKSHEVDSLNNLAALAQASASLPDQASAGTEPVRRKVGRPPKSSRPVDIAPVELVRKIENDAPIELSASGRPVRQRQRTKFSDDFIEGDFAQVLNDQNGTEAGKSRRRRRSSGPSQTVPKSAIKPHGAPNPLSASISAADTLHDIKHLYHAPMIAFPADYHQLMMQQMAMYQHLPMLGLQYSPQQIASLAHVYGAGILSPFPQNVAPQYFMTSPQDQSSHARQGLLSSDMAAVALSQFQIPAISQFPIDVPRLATHNGDQRGGEVLPPQVSTTSDRKDECAPTEVPSIEPNSTSGT